MKDLKPFQIAAVYGSIFFAIIGLIVFGFAGPKPEANRTIGPRVVIWGTFPQEKFNTAISAVAEANDKLAAKKRLPLNVIYQQKDPTTFETELLESIAAGESPDVVLLPVEKLLSNQNLVRTIPFDNYPERSFKDTFIDMGDLFRLNNGYYALPFATDPLVLYFNKTLLTQSNIINPPLYWDQVITMIPRLTFTEANLKIVRSAISLGEFRNINNSKDILSLLLLQAGTPIVSLSYDTILKRDELKAELDAQPQGNMVMKPGLAALDFFTQFADPSKSATYTWNRSLPSSKDFFLAGNLALYIGLGSEALELEQKNPNLDFDMAFVPQERNRGLKMTTGDFYGLAILKSSKNAAGSLQAMNSLTSNQFMKEMASISKLPPVRRDLLAAVPSDAYSPILYESALKSKGWYDINESGNETVFRSMVEAVLSGRLLPSDALERADKEMEVIIEQAR